MKEIFSVDPTSNLITRIDVYNEQDGQFQGPAIWEYVDYNQPMAAAFFALENEIPDDVTVFNTVGLDLGLEQGQLSNSEIAIKVVEAFLQACIDQNSTDAIQIFGYVSARQKQWIRDFVRKQDLVRILEIGTPLPPEPHQRGLLVPCTLESDHAGTSQTHTQTFHVREFVPGRWRIISVTHP